MFGGSYKQGWILPASEPITLNLYMYYDGTNQQGLDSFFQIDAKTNENAYIVDENDYSDGAQYEVFKPKADLYMYFTTELHCNEYKSHRPLEIVEKLGSFL